MLLKLRPEDINLKVFYGLTAVFTLLSLLAAIFGFYELLFLPLLFLVGYFLLFDTEKLMYLLAFAVPLSIPVKDVGGGLGMSLPTEPLIWLIFIGVIFKLLTGSNFNRDILKNSLSIIILADLGWLLITAFTSSMPVISFKYFLARTWFVTVFYFFQSHLFKKFRAMQIFLWAFCVATAILVIYTLFNHAQGSFTRYYAYTAMRPFLPDHGMYAAAISFCVPVLFVFALYGGTFGLSIWKRTVAGSLFILISTGVILSFTRASWLSIAAAFGIYLAMLAGIRFRTLVLTGIAALSLFVLSQQEVLNELSRNKNESADNIEEHLSSFSNVSTDPSNLERLNRWSCALRMFQEKPVTGWGPGTYTFQYAPFQLSSQLTIISTNAGDLGNVHSEYLRPLCESGIAGALFWLLIVLFSVNKGFYLFYHAASARVRYMSLAAVLSLITYYVHGVLNNYIEFDKIAVPVCSLLAMLTALQVWHNHPQQSLAKD